MSFFEGYQYDVMSHDLFKRFENCEPINKGFSGDKKYRVTTTDGTKYLLRVMPSEKFDTWENLVKMLGRVAALGVPMCVPVEFGTCAEGVYALISWIDGEDLENALPNLSESEQYGLGIKAGEILRTIHTIPAPENEENWAVKCSRSIDNTIQKHHEHEINKIDGSEHFIRYVEQNRDLLKLLESRPQCFMHGDYSVSNMMFKDGELKIIDFDRYKFGDPWSEFFKTIFSARVSPHFTTGQLHGYFNGEPPPEFFKLMALYTSYPFLTAISWAVPHGQEEVDFVKKLCADTLKWFDNMNNPVPTWYLKDFHVQWIDGIAYKLKEPFDFGFISKYGKVFKVFDEQGVNVCFGVQDGDKRYFVKFAGAKPIHFEACNGNTVLAIEWLKNAVSVYQNLEHPALIKFIKAEEIGGGYAAVFEWVDAIGIEPLNSPDYMRFMQMPTEKKMRAFEDIMEFHAHVAAKGYVAIDFYDGSILYDYAHEKVIICDIDFYQKSPYVGEMGLWGSSRFVSPEECTPGAVMDEITMVYTMGATAFSLFAYGDRSLEAWTLNAALHDVAKRAVSDERGERQQSIRQFMEEWRAAKA